MSFKGHLAFLPREGGRVALSLLDETPFKMVGSKPWVEEAGKKAWAPSTIHADQIVPKHWLGGLVRSNIKTCMKCHQDADKEARLFDSSRDWWGRVRGSDGILSFHPFDLSCISGNGLGKGVKLRKELVSAGLLRHWREK